MIPVETMSNTAMTDGTRISRDRSSGSTDSVKATCVAGAIPWVLGRLRSQLAAFMSKSRLVRSNLLEHVFRHRRTREQHQPGLSLEYAPGICRRRPALPDGDAHDDRSTLVAALASRRMADSSASVSAHEKLLERRIGTRDQVGVNWLGRRRRRRSPRRSRESAPLRQEHGPIGTQGIDDRMLEDRLGGGENHAMSR